MPDLSHYLSDTELDRLVAAALAEDVGSGDITSEAVIPAEARLRAVMVARDAMTVAGLPVAAAVFRACDRDLVLHQKVADGDTVAVGTVLMEISGRARAVLTAERTALNFVQHLSGIATLSRAFVDRVAGTGARIRDTRKTIPLLRALEKYAAACGGAENHRMGLFDMVLIKDNHIAARGSVAAAVAAARAAGHADIMVECETLTEVEAALAAGATRLLLDNMDPPMLARAVAVVGGRAETEASGGVRLET
ncbi:MAG: carboxylating nicotinate-nucleotide diphosphorylase, partial [Rhodothalassiaceae bacterium]